MSSSVSFNDMDEIIDNVYLGNLSAAENVTKLKELGIKKVLSILDGFLPKYNESDNIISCPVRYRGGYNATKMAAQGPPLHRIPPDVLNIRRWFPIMHNS